MLKLFQISLIFLTILTPLRAEKGCDLAYCNYEGECKLNNNEPVCSCIGDKYFKGSKCSDAINLCEKDNPCQNGAKCVPITGQFICQQCNPGYGGLWCDLTISNGFTNLLLYFNHYVYYAKQHKFLIMTETLGEIPFSLEFVGEHYAIDTYETKPGTKEGITKWSYSQDLESIIKKHNIRYYNDLPYQRGYYRVSTETFWNDGLLQLTLRSYDTATGAQLFYQNIYDLLILKKTSQCIPQLRVIHGSNPVDPLMLDIARYNNFEVILKQRCSEKSHIAYKWSVYNSIGSVKLYDFGQTMQPTLKVSPYRLWFNYHGEVMSSYQMVIRMEESYGQQLAITQARCFILVLPKPVTAIIKGGNHREIGAKQDFHMDGSASRDFALAPNVVQDMIYRWDCVSMDDPNNHNCREKKASTSKFKLKSGMFKLNANYKFTLHITSKINKLITDQTQQLVKIVEQTQLLINIQCIRNCKRQQFTTNSFLHLKIEPDKGRFSKLATFKWLFQEIAINQEQRLIYTPKDTELVLKFEVIVEDQKMRGRTEIELKKNEAPSKGTCSIEPREGEAFKTEFHIQCLGYKDEDFPLNYEYITEGFPLQRINDPEIYTKLPKTEMVTIKTCDQFEACREDNLRVKVMDFKEPKDLKHFITQGDFKLSKLLEKGNTLTAMILMKSLAQYIKTTDEILAIVEEINSYNFLTLLEIEQFLDITKDLVHNILPLDYKKSKVFKTYFHKINTGFESILKDREIKDIMKQPYEKLTQELVTIVTEFSKSWELVPEVQLPKSPVIQKDNPLSEQYEDLPDFDILTLERIENWLETSKTLHKSYDYMGKAGVDLFNPMEPSYKIDGKDINYQIYALDKLENHDIKTKNDSVFITLNEEMIQELQKQLKSSTILLQISASESNPYWWYPDEKALDTDVVQISAFSSMSPSLQSSITLKHPLQFQLKLKDPPVNSTSDQIRGIIQNKLHMPIYHMEVNANAVIIVKFIKVETPLKIIIRFDRNPRSYEVKNNGPQVIPSKLYKKYVFRNPKDEKLIAHMAIILNEDDTAENISFSFETEIRECLYWDYLSSDPQWSSKGCRPQLKMNKTLPRGLKCECYHLSSFAGKTYSKSMQEDLKTHSLLIELPFNWYMILSYSSLLFIFTLILTYNFYLYKNHRNYLITTSNTMENDIEIRIYTGSYWNAGTSANISLTLISAKGTYPLTIYQNSVKPQLSRNSKCKLRINSQEVEIPVKLVITNDQCGRFPSWHCRKIELENLLTHDQQIFHINQWIYQQTLEVIEDRTPFTFKQRFREHISQLYIEWYQFQPLWGCWLYEDLNRFERSCIWISQFVSCLSLVACYYGRTTMESYEFERDLYYSLNFSVGEILFLSLVCYLLTVAIKLLFILCLNMK